MSREQLGQAMGYRPVVAYGVVQQIEDCRKTAGPITAGNYFRYFQGLDLKLITRLIGQDRAMRLHRQLSQRLVESAADLNTR